MKIKSLNAKLKYLLSRGQYCVIRCNALTWDSIVNALSDLALVPRKYTYPEWLKQSIKHLSHSKLITLDDVWDSVDPSLNGNQKWLDLHEIWQSSIQSDRYSFHTELVLSWDWDALHARFDVPEKLIRKVYSCLDGYAGNIVNYIPLDLLEEEVYHSQLVPMNNPNVTLLMMEFYYSYHEQELYRSTTLLRNKNLTEEWVSQTYAPNIAKTILLAMRVHECPVDDIDVDEHQDILEQASYLSTIIDESWVITYPNARWCFGDLLNNPKISHATCMLVINHSKWPVFDLDHLAKSGHKINMTDLLDAIHRQYNIELRHLFANGRYEDLMQELIINKHRVTWSIFHLVMSTGEFSASFMQKYVQFTNILTKNDKVREYCNPAISLDDVIMNGWVTNVGHLKALGLIEPTKK
jgi:hypothetical protein